METTRRNFLKVSVGAGGIYASASSLLLTGCSTTHKVEAYEQKNSLSIWIETQKKDSRLVFICSQCEMGQGIAHALPVIFCEEFDFPPQQLALRFAPVGSEYKNPAFGMQSTGGSNSVVAFYEPMRKAGAACRRILILAAARMWGLDESQCAAKEGFVYQIKSPMIKASYSSLIAKAQGLSASDGLPLKDSKDFRLIGKSFPRIDNKLKLTAQAVYGIDAAPENSLKAYVIHAPVTGAKAAIKNIAAMKKELGIAGILSLEFGVVVVAAKYWQAKRVAAKLELVWDKNKTDFDSAKQMDSYKQACSAAYQKKYAAGIAKLASKGCQVLEPEYQVPYLAHTCMEPMNATVLYTEDQCTVWAPTQSASLTQEAVSRAVGLPYGSIEVHSTFCGGGFGRRFYQDYSEKAAMVAREFSGIPVQLLWSREEDTKQDFYRPNGAAKMGGAVDVQTGKIKAWYHASASPAFAQDAFSRFSHGIFPEWLGRTLKDSIGGGFGSLLAGTMENEGSDAVDYQAEDFDFHWDDMPTDLPLGFWRSVGHSVSGFYKESFVDELAHLAKKDPIEFRLTNLSADNERYKNILLRLADHPMWKNRKAGDGIGIAVHASFKSFVGELVRVTLADGQIKVLEAFIAADCGLAIDPDGVRAQMEGGFIYGLSAALFGSIDVKDGKVVQGNFHDFRALRIGECPAIEVDIIGDPSAEMGGCGEPSVPPVAAAVANAIFDLKGKRLRTLPLQQAWNALA